MLAAAALVPETALLVPGAAGTADVIPDVRAAALDAVSALTAAGPDRVVVVASSAAPGDVVRTGPLRPTLSAAGIDDDGLGWPVERAGDRQGDDGRPVGHVGASVALFLLRAVGWSGEVQLLTTGSRVTAELQAVGRRLAGGPERIALLLSGSLSARRGPDGPLPDDARAAPLDDAVMGDLCDLGPAARERLAAVPPELAAALAVSAWAPWQVLLGASAGNLCGQVHWRGAPFGATYAVLSWTAEQR